MKSAANFPQRFYKVMNFAAQIKVLNHDVHVRRLGTDVAAIAGLRVSESMNE
jgi:hypothetical protein